jgi:hypothetical protein
MLFLPMQVSNAAKHVADKVSEMGLDTGSESFFLLLFLFECFDWTCCLSLCNNSKQPSTMAGGAIMFCSALHPTGKSSVDGSYSLRSTGERSHLLHSLVLCFLFLFCSSFSQISQR